MELLSWDSVLDAMRRSSDWDLPMGGTRGVHFGHDGRAGLLFVRAPAQSLESAPPTRLSEIDAKLIVTSAGKYLQVSTCQPSIFREFHRFAGLLAEDLERGAGALSAFESALERWRLLASERRILSTDQQLGLMGELLLLRALVTRDGTKAVRGWTARDVTVPDRHDFRLATCDIEVKTTRTQRRRHVIHGLHQLVPARDRPLFVLSIMMRSAGLGEGVSLADLTGALREALASDGAAEDAFITRLEASGYRDADANHYSERLTLSELPLLVPVDESCPRITPTLLASAEGVSSVDRIGDVSYTVDLTGLGGDQSAPAWLTHLARLEIHG